MSQTSLTASFAQIIPLNPFPGNQPARIVGTKWRIKNRSKNFEQRASTRNFRRVNELYWLALKIINSSEISARGHLTEVFDLFLIRHFVLKNSSAMICSSDAVGEVWDIFRPYATSIFSSEICSKFLINERTKCACKKRSSANCVCYILFFTHCGPFCRET